MSCIDLSIVIPARNEERYIGAALASVAAQAWPLERLEVIVVDNGSTDRTAEIVQEFQQQHPSLTVQLLHEPQRGVSRARNRGLAAARAPLVLFLDADSRMAPSLTAAIIACWHRGYAAASIRIIADSPDWLDRAYFELADLAKRLFRVYTQLCYCERALALQVGGFDERLRVSEDYDFLRRVQRVGGRLAFLNDSWIATSPRRLRRWPFRLGMLVMTVQWLLALFGVGRDWPYASVSEEAEPWASTSPLSSLPITKPTTSPGRWPRLRRKPGP
ncbi:glycosyltransferase family 2 protein [Thermorudis peleae]|uniref:glycosyltransferase family 2 protein n=1 Tax=Thermorudis peleae TaxID=1382356 RepID=UPI00068D05C3|nr:glycosyltransferase [Thermorudis peleae]